MLDRFTLGIAGLLILTACAARPTGVAVMPSGQVPVVSGRVLGGEIKGGQVTSSTKVALTGYYLDAQGIRLDAQGQPTTADVLETVPVKDGRYGFDLPIPPAGVVRGVFGLVAYNDANDNNQIDAGEASSLAPVQIFFTPSVGYGVLRAGLITQDPTALGQIELKFE